MRCRRSSAPWGHSIFLSCLRCFRFRGARRRRGVRVTVTAARHRLPTPPPPSVVRMAPKKGSKKSADSINAKLQLVIKSGAWLGAARRDAVLARLRSAAPLAHPAAASSHYLAAAGKYVLGYKQTLKVCGALEKDAERRGRRRAAPRFASRAAAHPPRRIALPSALSRRCCAALSQSWS